MSTLNDLFAEDEAIRLAKVRREIEAEDAAWAALPQAEKDRIIAEREAAWSALEEDEEGDDEEDDDE